MASDEVKNGLKISNLAFLLFKVTIMKALFDKTSLKCADQSKSTGWGNLAVRPCILYVHTIGVLLASLQIFVKLLI